MKWSRYQLLDSVASKQCRKGVMANTSLYLFIAVLCSLLIKPGLSQNGEPSPTLCTDDDCSCEPHPREPDLTEVTCRCQPKKVLKVGGHTNSHNALSVPENAGSLNLAGCHHVEVFARTFNGVDGLTNVTISGSRRVVLHPRMYDTRNGAGSRKPPSFTLFEITNVHHLDVKQHAFEGIKIDGSFILREVTMEKVPSLAFNFDSIHDFTIFGSRFDRIAMWGIKLADPQVGGSHCNEFNVLGGSKFFSLASNAFQIRCTKFMLAYNTFDSLNDASLNVKSAVIDIQGNTFESLSGKPFIRLQPFSQKEIEKHQEPLKAGFIFRENKFAADPTLPFNALAFPAFDLLTESHVVMVEQNHFLCDCNKVAWFIGAMTHGFDRSVIANGRGSLDFLQKLYDTSGQCLKCDLRRCDPIPDQSFRDFTRTALSKHGGQLKCSASGQPLKSHSKDGGNGFDGEYGKGDEESIRDAKNCELLGSCAPLTAGAYSINTKTTELFLLLSSFFLFFQL